jgi:hypothetical protein
MLLTQTAERKKKSKQVKGGRISTRLFSNPATRKKFYAERPKHGTWDAEIQRSLLSKHKDGPKNHPYVQGLDAYGQIREEANPFDEQKEFDTWLWWFSGYHQARRDAGDSLELDVA